MKKVIEVSDSSVNILN